MLKKIIILGISLVIIGVVAITALFFKLSFNLPKMITVEDYKPLLVSEVFSRDNKKIGEFFREKRVIAQSEEIPQNLINAFIAAEDSSFYEHHGINFVAIFRAALANIKAGRKAQGASTITQQVSKSLLLTSEKTYVRKLREMILSYKMEDKLTKQEILYLYLNQIYFGQGAYGIKVATSIYFRKTLAELTLPEMALLAGLPKAPSRYSPVHNPGKAKQRQKYVLRRMAAENYITEKEAEDAINTDVTVYKRQNFKKTAPYYLESVRQLLVQELGEKTVLDEGLQIHTGLDFEKQIAAQQSLRKGLRDLDKRQGFRGPKKNLTDSKDIADFLLETRNTLLRKIGEQRTILPDGTNPTIAELKLKPLPDEENNTELATNIPSYIAATDLTDGIVIKIDDKWGLVYVRFAESYGIIDFATMTWARKPNVNISYKYDQIKKPSSALAVGDVISIQILAEKFSSTVINDKLLKLKKSQRKKYLRPNDLPDFDKWVHLELEQEPIVQSSLISFDQHTSDVLAMVGGYDFEKSEFNRVLQAARQTGSSFKALVYAAALDKGFTAATPIENSPIVYEEKVAVSDENDDDISPEDDQEEGEEKTNIRRWKPANHSKKFGGDILFRNALIKSLNVPAVKVLQKIGIGWTVEYARRLGIFSPLNMDYTLALGSSGITLYELTKVFSQFGRLGKRIRPVLIHQVLSKNGDMLLDKISLDRRFNQEIQNLDKKFNKIRTAILNQNDETDEATKKLLSKRPPLYFEDPEQLMKQETAYLITNMLEGTVQESYGTGIRARALGRRVAAKTGTTNGYFDGWFVGYTPQISTGVWVGFDQEQSLGRGEVGGRNALPIWLQYMTSAHKGLPEGSFQAPENIIFANIDNETGKIASADTKKYVRQAFTEGTEPSTKKEESSEEESDENDSDFLKEDFAE